MTLSTALFTFINVWCLTLFFVFAFSVKPENKTSPLDYVAAPKSLAWKKIVLLNTAISFGITLIIALVIKCRLIPLHTLVDGLS